MADKPLRVEVNEWKQNKVTKYLVETINADLELIKEVWTSGGYTTESQSGTIQLNSQALGSITAIRNVLDLIEDNLGTEESEIISVN